MVPEKPKLQHKSYVYTFQLLNRLLFPERIVIYRVFKPIALKHNGTLRFLHETSIFIAFRRVFFQIFRF